jgi:hypothetical protein
MEILTRTIVTLGSDTFIALVLAACLTPLVGVVAPTVAFWQLWLAAFGVRQITGS